MAKKNVFISFDYDNDKAYKNLLKAWDANSNFEFKFSDKSAHEINSENIGRVKAALTNKINDATYTLILIGKFANKKHQDSGLIDDINWINWEINKSIQLGKKLVAVKLDKSNESPTAIMGVGASWALSYGQKQIIQALEDA